MHAVHLHWRTCHCGDFYIYARAFAIQSSCRALVVGSDVLLSGRDLERLVIRAMMSLDFDVSTDRAQRPDFIELEYVIIHCMSLLRSSLKKTFGEPSE